MASYLRPRRGKEATAKSQNIVLKRGEIFFETPAGGVGTGIGRLKMGDGSTSYASLPYFLKQLDLNDNNTKCAFTNVTAATNKSNNNTYLNNIAPGNSLKTLFQNIKQLLLNYNSQLTSLNNDLDKYIVAVNQEVDNVSIPAGKSIDIAFNKFMYVKGWTRIVTNVSFWNATSGGKNYSFCINYAILYDTSHTSLQCRNLYTSDSAKVKVSITCLYYKDKLIGSNNIPS